MQDPGTEKYSIVQSLNKADTVFHFTKSLKRYELHLAKFRLRFVTFLCTVFHFPRTKAIVREYQV